MIFTSDEVPEDILMKIPPGKELRCPHWNEGLGKVCNKKFCNGDASPGPQEFKCPNCGKKTVFQRI